MSRQKSRDAYKSELDKVNSQYHQLIKDINYNTIKGSKKQANNFDSSI